MRVEKISIFNLSFNFIAYTDEFGDLNSQNYSGNFPKETESVQTHWEMTW